MAFGDLLSQLGYTQSQTQPAPDYGSMDPNQYVTPAQSNVPLLNPDHPLTQALMQSLAPQGAPAVDATNSTAPGDQIVASAHPKSQPIVPGSQTPTGGPVVPTGNPWQNNLSQTGTETPGIPDRASALFGLLHGGAAQTLNNFQDKYYMAMGLPPPNYTRTLQQQEANALQGFTDHPMEAIQRYAQVNPQGAVEMYNKQLESARVGQAAADTHAAATNALQDKVLGAAGRIVSNSTPDNYAQHYQLAQEMADRNGMKLDDLALPSPTDVAAGKGVVKNSDGTTSWDPDTTKTLATASNYGTPSYRVLNSQSSSTAANARMLGAQTGAAVAPSTIRFHNALAQAALSNTAIRSRLADIDADFHQGALDEATYSNQLKGLIDQANNPQLAGQIPQPPAPKVRGSQSRGQSPQGQQQAPQAQAPRSSGESRKYSPSTKTFYLVGPNGTRRDPDQTSH